MAVESCRVECEGSGVRFLCELQLHCAPLVQQLTLTAILPGTIDNEFRTKTATSQTGGQCEVQAGVKHSYENLLLPSEKGEEGLSYWKVTRD